MKAASRYFPITLFVLLFLGFIAASTIAPLAAHFEAPMSFDLLNHIASIMQAKLALAEGQLPIRQALSQDDGFYYPNFQFYSPSSYTIAGLIYKWLTPSNPFTALKMTLWLSITLGGFYMYRLGLWFLKSKPAALLTSVTYLTSPYYLIVLDHLCGFNEAVAIGIIPIILYYSFMTYHFPNQHKYLLLTAISWYLLITTHLITFVYSASLIGFLFFIVTLKNRHHFKRFIQVGIGFTLGCLLAMWFLAPILTLSKYFYISGTFSTYDAFSQRFPPFLGLFAFNANYFSLAAGSKDLISQTAPAVGIPILLGMIIAIYIIYHRKSAIKRVDFWIPYLIITLVIAILLTWSPLNLWKLLPQSYRVGQYSWRMLSQVIWAGSLITGWVIYEIFQKKLNAKHVILGTFILTLATSAWLPITKAQSISLREFFNKPKILFNPTAYLLNIRDHTSLVDLIDNYTLDTLVSGKNLALKQDYFLPRSLLDLAKSPTLTLEGNIPDDFKKNINLIAVINKKDTAKLLLKPGKFKWEIPLTNYPSILHSKENLTLQFKTLTVKGETPSQTNIPLAKIYLTGFYNQNEILPIDRIKKYCSSKNNVTSCIIAAPEGTKLLELPVFFYPHFLKVTLNGKNIPYKSILESSRALVEVDAIPGKTNNISVEFVGLIWANRISELAVFLCLLLLISSGLDILKLNRANI